MVPDPDTACVGLEYFCFEGDELWTMADDDLVELATPRARAARPRAGRRRSRGLRRARAEGLSDVRRGVRRARRRHQGLARPRSTNLQQVGRNGLHRYNNSDHSMLTAMRAVENICTAPTTTSGRSTRSRPTTRSNRGAEQPYQERPGAAVDAASRSARSAERLRPRARALAAPARRLAPSRSRRSSGGRPARSCRICRRRRPRFRRRSAAALALYALATLLRGERWRCCSPTRGAELSRVDADALTTVGYMGNNALPARAGDVMKALLTARRTRRRRRARTFGVLVAERMLDAAALGARVRRARHDAAPPARRAGLGAVARRGRPARRLLGRVRARPADRRRRSACGPSRRAARAVAALWAPRGAALLALSLGLWLVEGGVYAVLGARRRRAPHAARRPVRDGAGQHRGAGPGRARLRRHVRRRRAARRARWSAAPVLAAALAYVVLVRFVLFVPITLVGLVALVGPLRRQGARWARCCAGRSRRTASV